MKKPSKDLYNLIKSLTVSEKGYFVKFAKRHIIGDENNYLRLFDAINEQEVFDEDELKAKFKGEKFIRQFTTAKNYLMNMILKSLESYHSEESVSSKIVSLMNQYKILFEKTLFSQAETLLKRAKKLAVETENYPKLIDILRYERSLDYKKIGEPDFDKYALDALKEEKDILYKLENLSEYNNLYLRLSSLFKIVGRPRTDKDLEKFQDIISNPLMESEKKALSIRAKNFYYIISYLYFYCADDNEKAFEYGEKRLKLIEEHSEKINSMQEEYIYALSDAIAFAFNTGKIKLCLKYLKKKREIAIKYENKYSVPNNLDMCVSSYSFELYIYSMAGYFKEALETADEVIKWLDKYHGKINKSEEIKVIYAISYVYFGAGDYNKALFWINKILNDNSNFRQDYKIFAKIMNLIIHYELGNIDLLEYNIKSVLRYLNNKDKLYKYEHALIKFIKRIPYLNEDTDISFEFHQLKSEIEKISSDDFEKRAIEYFDIVSWLESKLTKKKFEEIVRSKSEINLEELKAA